MASCQNSNLQKIRIVNSGISAVQSLSPTRLKQKAKYHDERSLATGRSPLREGDDVEFVGIVLQDLPVDLVCYNTYKDQHYHTLQHIFECEILMKMQHVPFWKRQTICYQDLSVKLQCDTVPFDR